MDLMNEKSEFEKTFFKGLSLSGKIENIFKKNLKVLHSDICWNPIRDNMIIPIIPGSQSQLHDINDFRDQGILIIISLSPVDQRTGIINFSWKPKITFFW